jgi:hypothetical protein
MLQPSLISLHSLQHPLQLAQPTQPQLPVTKHPQARTCPCWQLFHGQAPGSSQAQGASDGDMLRHILSYMQLLQLLQPHAGWACTVLEVRALN